MKIGKTTNWKDATTDRMLKKDKTYERTLTINKKENIYLLTEKGIDLAPLILEMVLWSDKYVRSYNTKMNSYENQNLNKT